MERPARVYGEKLVYSGPMYRSMTVQGDRCRISFDHTADGLAAKGGRSLRGFLIAGADRNFVEARAGIEGQEVIVWSEEIKHPVAVRYAWADNPQGCNLWNKVEGRAWLPASPFRTDDW